MLRYVLISIKKEKKTMKISNKKSQYFDDGDIFFRVFVSFFLYRIYQTTKQNIGFKAVWQTSHLTLCVIRVYSRQNLEVRHNNTEAMYLLKTPSVILPSVHGLNKNYPCSCKTIYFYTYLRGKEDNLHQQ